MSWPRDDAKLDRVRALMAEQELDALVVRAPDNVLYLTNFWGMKGYDAVVFPREGDPVLDLPRGLRGGRGPHGLDDRGAAFPRLRRERPAPAGPPRARPRPPALVRVRARRDRAQPRDAGGRPDGRGADDLPEGLVRRVPRGRRRDAAAGERARDQDRAGGRADAARERDRGRRDGARPGADPAGDARERGRRALERLGARSRHRLRGGEGRARARLLARCGRARGSAPSRPPAAARSRSASRRSSRSGSVADGYWCDHTKNLVPGELDAALRRARAGADGRLRRRDRLRPAGSEPRRARPDDPRGPGRDRLSGPAEPSDLPRRRRPRARAALCAPGRGWHDRGRHGAGDRARGVLARRRRPPRRGQLPDHRDGLRAPLPLPRRDREGRDDRPRAGSGRAT